MATHEESIKIHTDGGVIAGTVISPATKLPGVLFVHGWGGSQQQYLARAREVAGLGAVCMTFDLTGHAGTAAHGRRGHAVDEQFALRLALVGTAEHARDPLQERRLARARSAQQQHPLPRFDPEVDALHRPGVPGRVPPAPAARDDAGGAGGGIRRRGAPVGRHARRARPLRARRRSG